MKYINETNAFKIVKKNINRYACAYKDGYMVSDGIFAFRTYNINKIIELGMYDTNGNKINKDTYLEHIIDRADTVDIDYSILGTLSVSSICRAHGKNFAQVLYNQNCKHIKLINKKYTDVFNKKNVIFKLANGDNKDFIYAINDERELLGFIASIQISNEEIEQLSRIDYTVFK